VDVQAGRLPQHDVKRVPSDLSGVRIVAKKDGSVLSKIN